MARSKKSAKKKKGVTVDFEGVDSSSRSIEDGWAHMEVLEAELTESSNENQMFKIKVQLTRGKEKAVGYDNLVLTPNALWKIKGLLEACGVEVPEGEMDIEEKDLVGLECEAEVVNEHFEGKDRPKLVSFRPAGDDEDEEDDDSDDDEDDDDEDEEEEAPKSKKKSSKKSKSKDEDEDEEDDDSDDDDEEDDDSDDDDSDDDDDDSDDDDDDDDDAEEDDEEDEDEDEKPKSKKKGKKAKLRAGMKVSFKDKGKTVKGVITSIDDDTIFVEDKDEEEWELSADEITVSK